MVPGSVIQDIDQIIEGISRIDQQFENQGFGQALFSKLKGAIWKRYQFSVECKIVVQNILTS